ncbi:hypothetical protein M422DRAFT_125805, partial [Sphaerobolus stellatus SS14]
KSSQSRQASWILVVFLLLDTALGLYFAYAFYSRSNSSIPPELEYRTPYVNLHELYRQKNSTTRYKPIQNRPRSVFQISLVDTESAIGSFPQKFVNEIGMISPPDKQLKVNTNTHSIVQFRSIDFGMEKCALTLRPPASRAETIYDFSLLPGTILDVCSLDLKRPSDISSHTPACVHFGSFLVEPGKESQLIHKNGTGADFSCPWGSWHTFRVSCSGQSDNCGLDIWSDDNKAWG